MSRPGRWLLGSAAALYAVFIARTAFRHDGAVGFTLFDDAFISMQYARNLASGAGLVWNAGEPPVEGYTNPLWMLWMAAVHSTGASDLVAPLIVAVSGALLLVATALLTMRLTRLITNDDRAQTLALALVLFSYPLMFWTLRGMEVGFVAFCTILAVYGLLRFAADGETAALMCVTGAMILAVLTRRDAAVAAVPLVLYAGMVVAPGVRWLAAGAIVGGVLLALSVQTWFSVWYFGDPLPNTYYLKMSGTPALERLGRGVAAAVVLLARTLAAPLVVSVVALGLTAADNRRPLLLLAGIVGSQILYSVHVGGDAWEYMGYANRYVAVSLPMLAVLVSIGITRLARQDVRLWRPVFAVLLGLVGLRAITEVVLHLANRAVPRGDTLFSTAPALFIAIAACAALLSAAAAAAVWRGSTLGIGGRMPSMLAMAALVWLLSDGAATARWILYNADSADTDARLAKAGLAIRDSTPADTVLAVTSAGALPYFSRRRSIDILGKTDPAIARMPAAAGPFHPGHNKWDLDRSIAARRPDLVAGLPKAQGHVRYLLEHQYQAWHGTFFAKNGSPAASGVLRSRLLHLYPDVPPHPEAR